MLSKYTTTPSMAQKRAMGFNLVVVFLFALTAVWLLTRTAVAANAINRDVQAAIVPVTADIDENLKAIPILDETGKITGDISAAAKPLGNDVASVRAHTDKINANLESTDTHVQSIGKQVNSIKASTGVIKPGIASITSSVEKINASATGINESLGGVATATTSVVSNLTSAENSLLYVLSQTGPLHKDTQGILASTGVIQGHTASIASAPILSLDLAKVLADLGLTSPLSAFAPSTGTTAPSTAGTSAPSTSGAPSGGDIGGAVGQVVAPVQNLLSPITNLLGGI